MKRRIALVLLVAASAIAVYAVWFSTIFDVREVRVFGTHRLTRAEIIRTADIARGQPVARINAQAVEARIATLRPVASVDVRHGFPHAIVIEIHERTAIAGTAERDGSWWLVDRTGTQFERVPTLPRGLVEVQGYTERFRGVGARIAASFPSWLRAKVDVVTVYAAEDVRLRLRSGKDVRWGGESRAARKAAVLQALLHIPARLYDVSAPDAPATAR